jgi:4-amino-4-deoxy-L-arabinose transferase-like glycosyltransferase
MMKTNTALSLLALAAALVMSSWTRTPPRQLRALVGILCGLAALMGLLVLVAVRARREPRHRRAAALTAATGVRREAPVEESGRFPNRMSPNAAVGLILVAIALFSALFSALFVADPRHGRRASMALQASAVAAVLLGFAALIGYGYGVVLLDKPTAFIRFSPCTSAFSHGALRRASTHLVKPVVGETLALVT